MEEFDTSHCGQTTAVSSSRINSILDGDHLFSGNFISTFFNYFVPGHGKGMCDSEGGISKHAVAWAALHGEKPVTTKDLYNYLSVHGVDIMSKTAHALHSPDKRQFHDFKQGAFLN